MTWRPIETAPKDGVLLLVYEEKTGVRCVGAWNNHQTAFTAWGDSIVVAPTHWMPLPDPPGAETDRYRDHLLRMAVDAVNEALEQVFSGQGLTSESYARALAKMLAEIPESISVRASVGAAVPKGPDTPDPEGPDAHQWDES